MQHGTKKEEIQDILENSIAVLEGLRDRQGVPLLDVIEELRRAKTLLRTLTDKGTPASEGRIAMGYEA